MTSPVSGQGWGRRSVTSPVSGGVSDITYLMGVSDFTCLPRGWGWGGGGGGGGVSDITRLPGRGGQ